MSDTWWPNWPCLKNRQKAIYYPIVMRFSVLCAADRPLWGCEESVWIVLPVCLYYVIQCDLFSQNAIFALLTLWPCWPEVVIVLAHFMCQSHTRGSPASHDEIRMLISFPVPEISSRPICENTFFWPTFENSPKIHFLSDRPEVWTVRRSMWRATIVPNLSELAQRLLWEMIFWSFEPPSCFLENVPIDFHDFLIECV